jgi:hypothetical protein
MACRVGELRRGLEIGKGVETYRALFQGSSDNVTPNLQCSNQADAPYGISPSVSSIRVPQGSVKNAGVHHCGVRANAVGLVEFCSFGLSSFDEGFGFGYCAFEKARKRGRLALDPANTALAGVGGGLSYATCSAVADGPLN